MPIKVERSKAERMVRRLYRDLFRRDPEPDVVRGLVSYFAEGRVSARIQLMRMLKSDEFFDKRLRHATPEGIAQELYRVILARPPESDRALNGAADVIGKSGWRVQVDAMINSEEYLGRFGDDNLPAGTA
jgi:phycobilisome rod-core linker protein